MRHIDTDRGPSFTTNKSVVRQQSEEERYVRLQMP
jgi:hypothetical protein